MKKRYLWTLVFSSFLVLAGLTNYLVFSHKEAFAADADDIDGVDIGIITIASSDHGANWYNFSGTDAAQGASLTVSPGETVDFMVIVFGVAGSDAVDDVQIDGNITNAAYVTLSPFQAGALDADLDGNSFNDPGFNFSGGIGTVAEVLPDPDHPQILAGTIQLSSNFPVGQTVMLGEVSIVDYTLQGVVFNPLKTIGQALSIKTARALGVGHISAFRIVINVAQATPAPTPVISQPTTLPATGGSQILGQFKKFISY